MSDVSASVTPDEPPLVSPATTALPAVAAELAAAKARDDARQAALSKMYPTARPMEPEPRTSPPGHAASAPEVHAATEPSTIKSAPNAETLYPEKPPTRGFVDFAELPAKPGSIRLDTSLIKTEVDMTDQGERERADLVAAFEHAGAGQSLAQELYLDAVGANKSTYRQASPESAMAELKALWGDRYDAKVAAARELVRKAAEKNPEITEFLNRTKLGNDPKFIRKLAARAAAEATRRPKK